MFIWNALICPLKEVGIYLNIAKLSTCHFISLSFLITINIALISDDIFCFFVIPGTFFVLYAEPKQTRSCFKRLMQKYHVPSTCLVSLHTEFSTTIYELDQKMFRNFLTHIVLPLLLLCF